jgi:hypothetical protein
VVLCLIGSHAAAAPADACQLVTAAEAGAAIGASVTKGPSVNGPNSSSCEWKAASGVNVIVTAKSAQMFEAGKRILAPTPVAGVGEEAYQTTYGPTYTVLSARKGGAAVTVSVRGLKDVAATLAAEKAVTRTALGRL